VGASITFSSCKIKGFLAQRVVGSGVPQHLYQVPGFAGTRNRALLEVHTFSSTMPSAANSRICRPAGAEDAQKRLERCPRTAWDNPNTHRVRGTRLWLRALGRNRTARLLGYSRKAMPPTHTRRTRKLCRRSRAPWPGLRQQSSLNVIDLGEIGRLARYLMPLEQKPNRYGDRFAGNGTGFLRRHGCYLASAPSVEDDAEQFHIVVRALGRPQAHHSQVCAAIALAGEPNWPWYAIIVYAGAMHFRVSGDQTGRVFRQWRWLRCPLLSGRSAAAELLFYRAQPYRAGGHLPWAW